jgi:hypothetical protein
MKATNPPPSVAAAALAAKQLAQRNSTRRNLVMLAGVVVGVLFFAGYVLLMNGVAVGAGLFVLAVGLGATVAGAFLLRYSSRLTPDLAACPQCGESWEIREGRSVPYSQRMAYWDKCPGCSLPMRTELLQRLAAAPGKAGN